MELRIRVGEFRLHDEEKKAVMDVLESGRITEGKNVSDFERMFARYVGTKHAVAVSSGSAALLVGLEALKALGKIRKGQKVITTPLTYAATSNAIVLAGLEPVFVDTDEDRFVITPETIRAHMESVRDASEYGLILPVHLMGYPCRMDEINRIAEEHGLLTFEDSAQAHGTVYKGRKTGSMSLLSDFSFYVAHNIQAGELGAITTDDYEIVKMARKLKANGRVCDCPVCTKAKGMCPKADMGGKDADLDPRFMHEFIGYNFKTMEFQAALAKVQIGRADEIKRRRAGVVKRLNEGLSAYSDVLKLPPYDDDVSYMAYPVVIKDTGVITRKRMRSLLGGMGIETRPLFGSIPAHQPAYAHLKKMYAGRLPNADYAGSNAFYIGCHQYLTDDDIEYVIKSFGRILGRK